MRKLKLINSSTCTTINNKIVFYWVVGVSHPIRACDNIIRKKQGTPSIKTRDKIMAEMRYDGLIVHSYEEYI